uniref:uncharacterized protein n=1 Tax=Semicossyphus pulcher TaxID=241346 RepID=UPI0037E8CC06
MKTVVWFGFVFGAVSAAGEVIQTKPGGSVTFKFESGTFSSVLWRHGNDMIIHISSSGMNRKGKGDIVQRSRVDGADLQVSGVKEEDAGIFTCEADRKTKQYTLLVVSVSASPSGVLQLGSTALLQCRVTGLKTGSTVQLKKPDGSQTGLETVKLEPVALSDEGTWKCLFTHDSVSYTESLVIRVEERATVAAAPTKKPKEVTQPTCIDCVPSPSSEVPLLFGHSWWVWVAVGVGSLVVILLLVIIIVSCQRIKKRKRMRLRKQNGHQPMKPQQYCQCNRPTAAAKPQQGRRKEKPLALPRQPLLME